MVTDDEGQSIMNGRVSKLSPQFPAALTLRSKVWLEVADRFAIGEGGAVLLQAVRDHGSLRQAAAVVGWSYRHAWDYVQRMEQSLGVRLVVRQPARPREGSRLTQEGKYLVQMLRELQRAVQAEAERRFRQRVRGTPAVRARRA